MAVLGPAVKRACQSFDEYWDYKSSVDASEFFDINQSINANRFESTDNLQNKMATHFPDLDRHVSSAAWVEEHILQTLVPVDKIRHIADDPGKNRSWLSLNPVCRRQSIANHARPGSRIPGTN